MLSEINNRPQGRAYSPIDARLILNIRWLAIFGQLAALLYTYFIVKLEIPIGPALFVIGLSVAMNVWQTRRTNVTRRKDDQNFAALSFDVMQLALLLYFTGGLLNPFCILFLAPVFVSAAILRRREAAILVGLVLVCVSLLAVYNFPCHGVMSRFCSKDFILPASGFPCFYRLFSLVFMRGGWHRERAA